MKLTMTALFDKKQLEGLKSYEELKEFIDYQILFNQNVERILRGNISVFDNISCRIFNARLRNNEKQKISLEHSPIGVLPLYVQGGVTAFFWEIAPGGGVTVSVTGNQSEFDTRLLILF